MSPRRPFYLSALRALTPVVAACVLVCVASARAEADDACGPNLSGRWNCGSWRSFCTGHHGKLRATITCCDANHYRCTFTGTFFKIIPFRYSVTLTVSEVRDGKAYFHASRNIPLFGGSFSCSGWATACQFHANYCSPKDRGVFQMSR